MGGDGVSEAAASQKYATTKAKPKDDEPSDTTGFYDVAISGDTATLLTIIGAIMFVQDLAGNWPYGVLPLFSARLLIILLNYISRTEWLLGKIFDPEKEITLSESLLRAMTNNKRKWLQIVRPIYCRWLGCAVVFCYGSMMFKARDDKNTKHWWQERLMILGSMCFIALTVESFLFNSKYTPYQHHIAMD